MQKLVPRRGGCLVVAGATRGEPCRKQLLLEVPQKVRLDMGKKYPSFSLLPTFWLVKPTQKQMAKGYGKCSSLIQTNAGNEQGVDLRVSSR